MVVQNERLAMGEAIIKIGRLQLRLKFEVTKGKRIDMHVVGTVMTK